jgi:lipooligosaccharide transport system ATP-binding protein
VSPLKVSHLSKVYRRRSEEPFTAVNDISFEVHAGECFGLLGPNGAGKSTTIQCVTGFYPATSGQVLVGGIDVNQNPKAARQILGVCSQDDNLDTDFSVIDQLARHATFYRIPVKEAFKRAELILERFGLTNKKDAPIESLSGGMRRRLQLARALISEPQLLILDEPTTGLDPDVRRLVWEILQEVRARGAAILLSTHYMDEAERLCDRIAILHQGKILDIDSPEKLVARYINREVVEEEVRPGVVWKRAPNLEDVYLKITGSRLGVEGL